MILFLLTANVQATADILEEQKNLFNISDFIKEANEYSKESFPEINMSDVLNSAIKGEINGDFWYKVVFKALGKETTNAIRSLGLVIAIIVIHSILNSISEGLENKSISQVVYYAQYVLIVTLIMKNFTEMIALTKNTIENLVGFMNCLTPILISLMITTGSITTANVIQPVILFLISFIGNTIIAMVLPFILVSTVLGVVSNLSDKIQIDKLSQYFKSGVTWILGVVLTLFVGFVSIEGTLSSSVDGITAKTAKAAVSNFIPIVGKILGDAVDAVLGCATVLKNAVGVVGVLVVIGICILPIIKLAILTIAYHLATAICEIIADKKIAKLLEQMANSFKILLAVLFSVSTMLIIGVTLTLKISNSRVNVQIGGKNDKKHWKLGKQYCNSSNYSYNFRDDFTRREKQKIHKNCIGNIFAFLNSFSSNKGCSWG
ncbi:MAG: stage III sporulation protein AE [Clostridia bacterium]|nr:stage III sporulation protein AE [Clostridia bacterium]